MVGYLLKYNVIIVIDKADPPPKNIYGKHTISA